MKQKTVCVIGLWHLGIVNAVGFAEVGYQVIGIEFDQFKIRKLQMGIPPLYEPGLEKRMQRQIKAKMLSFSSEAKSVRKADYVVIAYDSPVDEKDKVDIAPIIKATKTIAHFLKRNTPVVITSQVPLGTSEKIEKNLKKLNKNWQSQVAYVPENLRLGQAIERFLNPDMLILGVNSPKAREAVRHLYKKFNAKKILLDLRSAEMVKHALNAFLATSIVFGNEIAHLSERLGVDAYLVAKALKLDKRIGQAPILPGLGFSGGTLARDVRQLLNFAKKTRYKAPLLKSIITINEETFDTVINKLKKRLGNLKGKTVGILGLTYKSGTSTMRNSPTIKLIHKMLKYKVNFLAYDPKANPQEMKKYTNIVKRVATVNEAAKKSDVLLLLTEWPEFKEINYNRLAQLMKNPVIIDSKNFLDSVTLKNSGFVYEGYGRQK